MRPSAAPRFMRCGWSQYDAPPGTDSDAAREGTCAAWVSECVLNGDASTAEDLLGRTHENGWDVDQDMVKYVQSYIDTVRKHRGAAEVFMQHPSLPIGGTADWVAWGEDGKTLFITDLKFGYRIIEPTSWQLVAYMMLVLRNTPIEIWPDMIQLAIYQPRAMHKNGPYRKRVLSSAEAVKDIEVLETQIQHIMTGEAVAQPGPQCLDCAKAVGCTALTQSVYDMWDVVQSRQYQDPKPHEIASELVMLERMDDLFKARRDAVVAEAEARISANGYVPGWNLEKRYGKRKFKTDAAMIRMLTGIDALESKLCTPAELVRRGATEDQIKPLVSTPLIGTKLVRVDADDVAAHFAQAQKGQS